MAQNEAPTRPRQGLQLVEPSTGRVTQEGLLLLEPLWRQVVAGFVVVPVLIVQTDVNGLQMAPLLHQEGAEAYGSGMAFWGKAVASSTGAVTARMQSRAKSLPDKKVYKSNGAIQAGAGDIVLNSCYLFIYHEDLDGGDGGFVLK
jgi:hypothetical protein